jgi:hypothetical protein
MTNPILALYSAEAATLTDNLAYDTMVEHWELNEENKLTPGDESVERALVHANACAKHYYVWAEFAKRGRTFPEPSYFDLDATPVVYDIEHDEFLY